MAARVVHFGEDLCHRIPLLRRAGFSAVRCKDQGELRQALELGGAADAVLIVDTPAIDARQVRQLARSLSSAPLVLFSKWGREQTDTAYDLVVHSLTPPDEWVEKLTDLIAREKMDC